MLEKKPVIFLLLATAAILVGTIITMALPFASINTESDRITSVKPYTPLQLAGRDVYIREGCNNCHTQTVRPLVSDVLRYGDYSKSGEFVYDRPHLWGSRRMGPDLARIGGKYPDSWHQKHMENPKALAPRTNMPSYAFIKTNMIDPDYTRKKMQVLDFPFKEEEIRALSGKTEMDALIAYMQKLGNDIPWRKSAESQIVGNLKNPYMDNPTVMPEGMALYAEHCSGCHGSDLTGGIGPDIHDLNIPDAELFKILHNGITDSGMPGYSNLGSDKVWKLTTFIKMNKRH